MVNKEGRNLAVNRNPRSYTRTYFRDYMLLGNCQRYRGAVFASFWAGGGKGANGHCLHLNI